MSFVLTSSLDDLRYLLVLAACVQLQLSKILFFQISSELPFKLGGSLSLSASWKIFGFEVIKFLVFALFAVLRNLILKSAHNSQGLIHNIRSGFKVVEENSPYIVNKYSIDFVCSKRSMYTDPVF